MGKLRKWVAKKRREFLTTLSPVLATKSVYKRVHGKPINLKNPRTLDEKIQWLKLNTYRDNPLISHCADKYAVRMYVQDQGCEEILNPLYGAYDRPEEIPWDELPNRFVVKTNFGCHQNLIVTDKSKLDMPKTLKTLKSWMRTHGTWWKKYAEVQYRSIPPKLVVEKMIETSDGSLPIDYKVYCFNGKPHCVLVCLGRNDDGLNAQFYFLDREGKLLRYNRAGKEAPKDFKIEVPKGFDKVFEYAEKLSKPFPFVRADFYLEDGKVWFGELTFTPNAGLDPNRLPETQLLFGDMVKLPEK